MKRAYITPLGNIFVTEAGPEDRAEDFSPKARWLPERVYVQWDENDPEQNHLVFSAGVPFDYAFSPADDPALAAEYTDNLMDYVDPEGKWDLRGAWIGYGLLKASGSIQ